MSVDVLVSLAMMEKGNSVSRRREKEKKRSVKVLEQQILNLFQSARDIPTELTVHDIYSSATEIKVSTESGAQESLISTSADEADPNPSVGAYRAFPSVFLCVLDHNHHDYCVESGKYRTPRLISELFPPPNRY
jgi:hypothetical protein